MIRELETLISFIEENNIIEKFKRDDFSRFIISRGLSLQTTKNYIYTLKLMKLIKIDETDKNKLIIIKQNIEEQKKFEVGVL